MSRIILDLQIKCNNFYNLPSKKDFLKWIYVTFPKPYNHTEITIRLVNEIEIHKLNLIYCNKNNSTNILTFLFEPIKGIKLNFLGDIIICSKIVEKQAKQQKKNLKSHWAHLTIHGLLHLLGYNHISKKSTKKMELLEKKIMKKLGYSNPYIL